MRRPGAYAIYPPQPHNSSISGIPDSSHRHRSSGLACPCQSRVVRLTAQSARYSPTDLSPSYDVFTKRRKIIGRQQFRVHASPVVYDTGAVRGLITDCPPPDGRVSLPGYNLLADPGLGATRSIARSRPCLPRIITCFAHLSSSDMSLRRRRLFKVDVGSA